MFDLKGIFDKVQICVAVKNLDEAMKQYGLLMGVDAFAVYTVDSNDLPGVTYRGQPADYGVQVAIADVGKWQIELLQHHRGECIYKEFVDENGEGVHHLGFFVEDEGKYEDTCQELINRGYPHIQGGPILGKHRDGRFDYFDSKDDLGVTIELLDMPEFSGDLEESL